MSTAGPEGSRNDVVADGHSEATTEAGLERFKRRRRRFRRGLLITLGLIVVGTGMAWWNMIRMPGKSYRGELPPPDEQLASLADELRRDVAHLAVNIGERNVLNHPQELAVAADWIEAELKAAGYEVKRQEYGVSGVTCFNLEVEILGKNRADEITVLSDGRNGVTGLRSEVSGAERECRGNVEPGNNRLLR